MINYKINKSLILLSCLQFSFIAQAMTGNPQELKFLAGKALAKNVTSIANLPVPEECLPFLGLIKLQKANNNILIKYDCAKILDGFEYLNINSIEHNTKCSFEQLIQLDQDKGLPFILAVISVRQKDGSVAHYYRKADIFNKLLFGENYLSQPKEIEQASIYEKGLNYFGFRHIKDDLLLKNIESIHYFLIFSNDSLQSIFVGTHTNLGILDNCRNSLRFLFLAYQGDAESQATLGFYYDKINPKLSKLYYTLAALQGHIICQNNLGFIYYKENDLEKAKQYYILSANQGNEVGEFNVGHIFHRQGDLDQAKHYYTLSANKGYPPAQSGLGRLSEQEGDWETAKHYHNLAASQGYPRSCFRLSVIYKRMGDKKQSEHYYALTSKNGYKFPKKN